MNRRPTGVTGAKEPVVGLPAPWQWVRRAGLWAAQDPSGTLVRSWSVSQPSRMITTPRHAGTRPVMLAVYQAVAQANANTENPERARKIL